MEPRLERFFAPPREVRSRSGACVARSRSASSEILVMKAVVFGGTTGIGRAIARRLAERGDSVFSMGIDPEDLARSAADLRERNPKPP